MESDATSDVCLFPKLKESSVRCVLRVGWVTASLHWAAGLQVELVHGGRISTPPPFTSPLIHLQLYDVETTQTQIVRPRLVQAHPNSLNLDRPTARAPTSDPPRYPHAPPVKASREHSSFSRSSSSSTQQQQRSSIPHRHLAQLRLCIARISSCLTYARTTAYIQPTHRTSGAKRSKSSLSLSPPLSHTHP